MPIYSDNLSNTFFLLLVLLIINFILKIKTFLSPIDHDTANHLYFAFLKSKRVPFISSYSLGIKFLLPRIYSACSWFIKEYPYRFRIINIASSSILIILLITTDSVITQPEVPFYFLGVLLINSLWVNYLTSASEFHEVLILILIFSFPATFRFELTWICQVLLLIILIGGGKFVNIVYSLPIIGLHYKNLSEHGFLVAIGAIVLILFTYRCIKNNYTKSKTYSLTRKWSNPKSLEFLKRSPHFWVPIFLLGLCNLLFASWEWGCLQLMAWIIFFIQRSYMTYFFYPPLALGFFIAFQSEWFNNVPISISSSILIITLLFHTVRQILLKTPRDIDIRYRNLFSNGWAQYLNLRDKQVDWLKKNLHQKNNIYLWGSNVALFLLAGLIHSKNTFYTHNHLIYWSNIEDKMEYAVNYILEEKPQYIIESGIMENVRFPAARFEDIYCYVDSIGDMAVYKLIDKPST